MKPQWPYPIDAKSLQGRFDETRPLRFGLEEEIMVLDAGSLNLLPCGPRILEGLDARFKAELPASHVEIATSPHGGIDDMAQELHECRGILARHVGNVARFAVAGVHPFAARSGAINSGERYDRMLAEYGDVLRQQLVCGLHVHVDLGGADRTLGVYNALRSWLPELAALGANAPVHCGMDSSLASVRPLISGLLPRQGMPPPLSSWQEYADHLNWGLSTRRLGRPGEWWWELRPHAGMGTLEVRVPDAQTTADEALAVAAVVVGTVVWLGKRYDASDLPAPVETWRINENRWSSLRHGLDGTLIDLETGVPQPARERVGWLIDEIAPVVQELGGVSNLRRARLLAERNGAEKQREVFAAEGAQVLTQWLAERFVPNV